MNKKQILAERNTNRSALIALQKPKRVPVFALFSLEAACGHSKINLLDAHYDLTLAEKAHESICDTFYSDSLPTINLRYPPVYDILGAKNWVLGSNGAMQHSGFEIMHEDEYDEFISDPFKMIMEVFVPRVCSELNANPVHSATVFAKAFSEYRDQVRAHQAIYDRLIEKHAYAPGIITGPTTVAPFDFIADQFRGFNAMTGDVYRIPDKVEAAVKAVTPYMIRLAAPKSPEGERNCFIPLHMAPFISPKHFEQLYWPSLKELVDEADRRGVSSTLFIEQDWTRYLHALESLPESSIGWIDGGDPVKFTGIFGQRHVFGGFFDPTITLVKSSEECVDEAKRILDICMKSEHFFFTFDRSVMDIKSIDAAKLENVLEWVRDNAKY